MANPLIVRFGALGDLVLCTPVLRALAERHGAPCDIVGSGRFIPDLFAGLPYVGQHFIIGSRSTPYWFNPDQWALVRWLRQRAPAPVYVLQSDAVSVKLVGRGCTVTNSVAAMPALPREHVVEHFARVTGTLPGPVELRSSAEEITAVDRWLDGLGLKGRDLVLIQPGNNRTMRKGALTEADRKFWPSERWQGVIRGVLAARPDAHVLVIGAPSECPVTEPLAHAIGDPRVRSVAHDLPLRRLFALFTRAHSLISVDTGPAHAAAACGCPVTVLFAAADPRRIRPFHHAVPIAVVSGPPGAPEPEGMAAWIAAHHMDGISVDAVLAAWHAQER